MFNEIEGGFYGIEIITTDGGKKYLPINIQLELEAGDTLVINSGYIDTDAVSIFMWGQIISLPTMK